MDIDKNVFYNEVVSRTKKFEGLRLKCYKCSAGKNTIGWGRNLDDVGISKDEAELMFRNDINVCIESLEKNIPFFYDLPENVMKVLIDMRFNLGLEGLLKFKKMLQAISEGNYEQASVEIKNSRYAKQVGKRALDNANLLVTATLPLR